MMRQASQDLSLEVMRVFALAGAARLADTNIQAALMASQFYSTYQGEIETDASQIELDLKPAVASSPGSGSKKFYPLPFFEGGHFDIVLFRPHFFNTWDGCKIELIQIGKNQAYLPGNGQKQYYEIGYRIERGHRSAVDRHGYLHVQLTREFKTNILVDCPAGLSENHPAFPIVDVQPYAPLYAALVAFTGLQSDWQTGLVQQLENARAYGHPDRFDQLVQNVKTVCYTIFFQRNENLWNRIAGSIRMFLARWGRAR